MANYRKIHFGLKHRLVAALSRRANFTYTIKHGLASGMRRRGGLGFLPWGGVETEEIRFLRALDLTGKVVYDIGAFEGLLTLYFSRKARQVVAWEPNTPSRIKLSTNLSLNQIGNVIVRDVGLSDRSGDATLVYDPLMPGAASAAGAVADQIRGLAPEIAEVAMRVVTLDDDMRNNALPPPDLMKIDVEGMERAVLVGAERIVREHGPALYIELHGAEDADKRTNAHQLVSLLWNWNYRDILNVETGENVIVEHVGRPSHIFCRRSSSAA
jgi:FkbM family methyltransferase